MSEKYTCEDCKYETNSKAHYNRHLTSTKHKKNIGEISKYHQCSHCDYSSLRLQNLKLHINRVHDPNYKVNHKFECLLCHKSFRDKFNLITHTKSKLHYKSRIRALNEEKNKLNKMDDDYDEKYKALIKKYSAQIIIIDKDIAPKKKSKDNTSAVGPSLKSVKIPNYDKNNIEKYLFPVDDIEIGKREIALGLVWLKNKNQIENVDYEYYRQNKDDMSLDEINDFHYEVFTEIQDILN